MQNPLRTYKPKEIKTNFVGMKGKGLDLKFIVKFEKNHYKKDLLQALAYLAKIAEESGQYMDAKKQELESVQLLKDFINNRI
tara:strand:- start:7346 stop:7591 length:246 start_codon:yes stop_codon:yes gene_type:complete